MFLHLNWSPSVVNSIDWTRFGKVHVCKSHRWQSISELKPSHEVKGTACRALKYRIVLRQKFGTATTLLRAGRPSKPNNQGTKALGERGDQEPDGHLQRSSVEMRETSRRTTITATFHWSGPDRSLSSVKDIWKPTWEFAKKKKTVLSEKNHLNDFNMLQLNCAFWMHCMYVQPLQ